MVALACTRALAFSLWDCAAHNFVERIFSSTHPHPASILVRAMNAVVHATEAWMFFIMYQRSLPLLIRQVDSLFCSQSNCVPTASVPCGMQMESSHTNAIAEFSSQMMCYLISAQCPPSPSSCSSHPLIDHFVIYVTLTLVLLHGAACCLLRLPPSKHVSKVDANNAAKETKQH
jgi:hypothetical protein